MTWKEVYVERGHLGLPGKIIGILVIVMLLFPLVPMTYFELYLEGHVKAYREEVNVWVRIATGMFATMAYFSACLRGAASITSEKDRDTWTNLVSSGLSAGEILWGKWWGSMRAPRSLYRVIIFCWLFATLVGAVNVLMLFATALTMSIHLAAYSWLGMLCSVNARTTMIASVRAFLAAIFVSGGFWIVFACCGSIVSTLLPRSPFQSGFLEDIVTIPVACTPPFIVGWMPHPWETLHRDWAPFDDQRVVYLFIGIGIWILFAWILKFWVEKKFLAATNRKHLDD